MLAVHRVLGNEAQNMVTNTRSNKYISLDAAIGFFAIIIPLSSCCRSPLKMPYSRKCSSPTSSFGIIKTTYRYFLSL